MESGRGTWHHHPTSTATARRHRTVTSRRRLRSTTAMLRPPMVTSSSPGTVYKFHERLVWSAEFLLLSAQSSVNELSLYIVAHTRTWISWWVEGQQLWLADQFTNTASRGLVNSGKLTLAYRVKMVSEVIQSACWLFVSWLATECMHYRPIDGKLRVFARLFLLNSRNVTERKGLLIVQSVG